MQVFELVVRPKGYELHCPDVSRDMEFPTLLDAFTHAQISMSDEHAEMLVHRGDSRAVEHVPLYRLTF
jgi:hypothetical protein